MRHTSRVGTFQHDSGHGIVAVSRAIVAVVRRYASRWRYPRLLLLTGALFAADLVLPDVIPLVDEILLGLGTVVLASLRRRRLPPVDGQTPRD